MKRQVIAFSRNKFICSNKEAVIPSGKRLTSIATLRDELARFGIGLNNDLLLHLSNEDVNEILTDVLPEIAKVYHAGKKFLPLYPGWPEQTISKTNEQLLIDRDLVYETSVEEFQKNNAWYEGKKDPEKDKDAIRIWIKMMTEDEFMEIPTNIMKSNSSLDTVAKKELEWFLDNYTSLKVPSNIPFKETLCIVSDKRPDLVELKDVNDVLKFGYYKMGVGDLSLPSIKKKTNHGTDNFCWRRFSSGLKRSDRRNILERLEKVIKSKGEDQVLVDANREYGHWMLLSERIHSGDYATKYPKARQFFENLQGGKKAGIKSFYSVLQSMYDNKADIVDIAKFLSTRPGEFVRRFDSVIRRAYKDGKEAEVFDVFLGTKGFKNRTLLSLINYYERRAEGAARLVKTKDGRMYELPRIESFNKGIIDTINSYIRLLIFENVGNVSSEEEKDEFKGKSVWVDPACKDIPIPLDMRDIEAQGFNIIPRGTKLDIPEDENFIRFFVHWYQKPGTHEDLDLHAFLTSEDGQFSSRIGWNSNHKTVCANFSGDVLDRDGDCAEYVDIDIARCLEQGYRYVTMDVYNYRGEGFDKLPTWLGFSYRDDVQGGDELWVPSQVVFSRKTERPSVKNIFAWLFDLKERKAILIDTSLDDMPTPVKRNQLTLVKYFTTNPTISCKEIVEAYYTSRGATLVDSVVDPENTIIVNSDEICLDYTKILKMLGE